MIKEYVENEQHNQKVSALIDKRIEKAADSLKMAFWASVAVSVLVSIVTVVTWMGHYPEYVPFF